MDFHFDESLSDGYKSGAQKIRRMSEEWVARNIYCPSCGNPHISHLPNNEAVADFQCDNCGEIFELKSSKGRLGKKVLDGAYSTMIQRITSSTNPDLLLLQYNENSDVTDLLLVPKFFFVPAIIEKRPPLPPTARRAGWTGCNILISQVPIQGRIGVITSQHIARAEDVVAKYAVAKRLQTNKIEQRGWLMDVLNCVNEIPNDSFTLAEVYAFESVLHELHPENKHIRDKIRQQLQYLRDRGFVAFDGRGKYHKLG